MMETRYYSFAGVDVCISAPEDLMFPEERRMAAFRTEQKADAHQFLFTRVPELPEPGYPSVSVGDSMLVYSDGMTQARYLGNIRDTWDTAYLRAEHREKRHDIQLKAASFPGAMGVTPVLNALAAEHLVLDAGGVVFHASYILHNDRAILFTAPSGTGKSTQADLWVKHRNSRIVNGDRAVIRIVNGQAVACGLPFAGSSEYCENVTAPLAAIVYLAQAPKTQISRLTGFRAFRRVWEGCSVNTWDRADVEKATAIVEQIIRQVPVYYLPCTPDETAVAALEGVLV